MTETDDQRTDRMAREGRAQGKFRQCSIGWHDECSDPAGEECTCICHVVALCKDPRCAAGCLHCGADDSEWCKPDCNSPIKSRRDRTVHEVADIMVSHRVTYQMSQEGDFMCSCGDIIKLADFPVHIANEVVEFFGDVDGENY